MPIWYCLPNGSQKETSIWMKPNVPKHYKFFFKPVWNETIWLHVIKISSSTLSDDRRDCHFAQTLWNAKEDQLSAWLRQKWQRYLHAHIRLKNLSPKRIYGQTGIVPSQGGEDNKCLNTSISLAGTNWDPPWINTERLNNILHFKLFTFQQTPTTKVWNLSLFSPTKCVWLFSLSKKIKENLLLEK